MIDKKILLQYGAHLIEYPAGQYVFHEKAYATSYYQIETGCVKMVNETESKDFIQQIFISGQSFGEPAAFAELPYPASAKAIDKCSIWRLNKEHFMQMLQENPAILMKITTTLAQRLHFKAQKMNSMTSMKAKEQVVSILNCAALEKRNQSITMQGAHKNLQAVLTPYTRQQIADLLGLRIETVVRILTELKKEHRLVVVNNQLYWQLN